MKKLIFLPLILLLSSCTLFPKTPASFEEYYIRNTKATIESTESTMKSLGFFRSYEINGVIDALVSIPVLLSGSFISDYTTQTDGKNASLTLENTKVQYDGLAGSGLLSLDTLGVISEQGNLHILYKNLTDIGFSTPEMRDVFARFDGTWLSWTQLDARAGITDPAELQAMAFLDNLSGLDRDKIEKYLTSNIIWKSTEDLGMSGALHMYRVELDRDNVLALMSSVKLDMTGVAFTAEESATLRDQLALVNLRGTMGFDPEGSDNIDIFLTLIDDTSASLGTLSYSMTEAEIQVILTSTDTAIALTYTYTHTEDRNDMSLTFTQSGREMGSAVGYVTRAGDEFRELGLDITAQGITVTLKHNQKEDGSFDGRILLPVGSISWNGVIDNKKLTALKVQ